MVNTPVQKMSVVNTPVQNSRPDGRLEKWYILRKITDVALMYIFSAKPAHDDPQRRELSLDGGQDTP